VVSPPYRGLENELTQVSQVVRTGTQFAPLRTLYGYQGITNGVEHSSTRPELDYRALTDRRRREHREDPLQRLLRRQCHGR